MIDKNNLLSLGYIVKTHNMHPDSSTDFKYVNFKERPYLVNLSGDQKQIKVDFPSNTKLGSEVFNDFSDFENWHNDYS